MPQCSFAQYIKSNLNAPCTAVDRIVSDYTKELDLETRLVEYIDEHELSGIEIYKFRPAIQNDIRIEGYHEIEHFLFIGIPS